jgi:hypothetical protein
MTANEVLAYYFGPGAITAYRTNINAMARDAWPSAAVGSHPESVLHPKFKPGDKFTIEADFSAHSPLFSDIKALMNRATARWAELGLPITRDEWRDADLPDGEAHAKAVSEGHAAITKVTRDNYAEVCEILSLVDNAAKFTIQRYVPPAWYIQDMGANHVAISPLLKRAVAILKRIAQRLLLSDRGKLLMRGVLDEYSDPFGTAVGWPLFKSATLLGDDEEPDDAKLEVLSMLEGSLKHIKWRNDAAVYDEIVRAWVSRVPDEFARSNPLVYLVNRRYRVGGKFNPDWGRWGETRLLREMKGAPYMRIAQAAPWVGNLLQGTLMPYFKALRMMLKGCYHTAELSSRYVNQLRDQSRPWFVAESDISQYDLNLAIEVTDAVDDVIASLTPMPAAAKAILHKVRRTAIAMPDPSNVGEQKRALVISGDIMLPSGIKLTAEYGTLCNVLVTICWMINAGWRERDILTYWDADDERWPILWLMQGDDKAVMGHDLPKLTRQVAQEATMYPLIGTTAKVALCDRFLQKHMYMGALTPVIGRMIQQRLSNEHPPESPEQYMMGVVASMVGVNGYTQDTPLDAAHDEPQDAPPPGEGTRVPPPRPTTQPHPGMVRWQREALRVIIDQLERAEVPQGRAIAFLKALDTDKPDVAWLRSENRQATMDMVAFMTEENAKKRASALSRLLLFRDRYKYSASVADFFDELASSQADWATAVEEYERKKVLFAKEAYATIGLPQDLFMQKGP